MLKCEEKLMAQRAKTKYLGSKYPDKYEIAKAIVLAEWTAEYGEGAEKEYECAFYMTFCRLARRRNKDQLIELCKDAAPEYYMAHFA